MYCDFKMKILITIAVFIVEFLSPPPPTITSIELHYITTKQFIFNQRGFTFNFIQKHYVTLILKFAALQF